MTNDKNGATLLHNFILEEAGNKLGTFLGTIVPPSRPVSLDLILTSGEKAALRKYFERLYPTYVVEDPESGGELIDDVSGYMRDGRVYNNISQTARNALRLGLKAEDKVGLESSNIPAMFYGTDGQKDASIISTDYLFPSSLTLLAHRDIQIEHVLEVAVVAHMIDNIKFVEEAQKRGLQDSLTLETLADLAETLKEKENLVKDVVQSFNSAKEQFFVGNSYLSIPIALYLEERSRVQRAWIYRNAANHENPYVRLVFEELSKTRFAQGGWYQLIGSLWFIKTG
ncbi:hypothetical protein CVT26_000484 [Gymnopilus dilepis]|uniref:Uncharacterized protein n=1 Tax=Gymnopilus dilepis TaxID=231916 RepID=A0A409VGZ4_9AGAR|nr:hypothetical protein CVT26_000484 [Gymnopilus dilepis]